MINNVVLMGRIVHTPEIKTTGSGIEMLPFTLAVERSYQKSGEERQTDFIDCMAWRQTAVFISQYFKKGSMIAVTGEIQTRNYEDKNGNKRKAVEVVVSQVSFCGGKNDSSPNGTAPKTSSKSLDVDTSEDDSNEMMNDDDLPF